MADAGVLATIRGLYHAGRAYRPATWELEAACGFRSPGRVTRLHRRLIETGEVPCLPAAPTRQTAIGRAEAACRALEIRERAGRRPGRDRPAPPEEGVWRRVIREARQREEYLRPWVTTVGDGTMSEATWNDG